MVAGAVLGLGVAVALTPAHTSEPTPLLLVLQSNAQIVAQPRPALTIRSRS
jgi:hypothetical protein